MEAARLAECGGGTGQTIAYGLPLGRRRRLLDQQTVDATRIESAQVRIERAPVGRRIAAGRTSERRHPQALSHRARDGLGKAAGGHQFERRARRVMLCSAAGDTRRRRGGDARHRRAEHGLDLRATDHTGTQQLWHWPEQRNDGRLETDLTVTAFEDHRDAFRELLADMRGTGR